MIRIAICDDELQELERTENVLKIYACEHAQYDITIHSFSSPIELLTCVERQGGFDVLLLDVYMPGVLGTDTARELRKMGDRCQLIFLTTSRDHAVEAFSLHAAHYLVKPYAHKELFEALDKAIENLSKKAAAYITLKTTEGIRRVELNKIVYSEADNHFQRIYLADGRTIITRRSSIELFKQLEEEPRFCKCGSAYIINMDYITQIHAQGILLSTGAKIKIPGRKYAEFKSRYMDYSCS